MERLKNLFENVREAAAEAFIFFALLALLPVGIVLAVWRDLGFRLLWGAKDGGPESRVYVWGIENKRLGSLLLLRFDEGSREAYHSHAFEARSLVMSGCLFEYIPLEDGKLEVLVHEAPKFVYTPRERFHRVVSHGTSWVLSARGPWFATWKDLDLATGVTSTLTHGRKVVETDGFDVDLEDDIPTRPYPLVPSLSF